MPTICTFYGLLIQMFFRDHAPPHFHVRYGEFKAVIDIKTLEVIEGTLPRRALNLTQEWGRQHREELMDDWNLCQNLQNPKPIKPLE